jgi:murein DD-endopeptidase MepM/ murein hydrolase activator NlpD
MGQVMVHTPHGGYLNNDVIHEHHSPQAQSIIEEKIAKASLSIPNQYRETQKEGPIFDMPIRKSGNSFVNNGNGYYYAVSAYFDHNMQGGSYHDLNCGYHSYDSHRGTDYFAFPFYWFQHDEEMLDVVSAAEGEIVVKVEQGEENCSNDGSYGAHLVIQHGHHYTLYAHLKIGTLTTKQVGDRVSSNEYLGKVGYSGNSSSGPHLHFQVFQLDTALTIDPYKSFTGCQSRSADLMKRSQEEEFLRTEMLSLTTHERSPIWKDDCQDPSNEKPYFDNEFCSGDTVYFIAAVRDFKKDQFLETRLIRPDGSQVFDARYELSMRDITGQSYAHKSAVYAKKFYVLTDDDELGTYELSAFVTREDGSRTSPITHIFEVSCLTSSNESVLDRQIDLQLFPNPVRDQLTIQSLNSFNLDHLELRDLSGRNIELPIEQFNGNELVLDVASLHAGVYSILITDFHGNIQTKRFIKQ